jgi:hypothetical protein
VFGSASLSGSLSSLTSDCNPITSNIGKPIQSVLASAKALLSSGSKIEEGTGDLQRALEQEGLVELQPTIPSIPVTHTNPFLMDDSLPAENRPKLVKKAKAPPPPVLATPVHPTSSLEQHQLDSDEETRPMELPESPQLLYQSPGYLEESLLSAPSYPFLSTSTDHSLLPPMTPESRLRQSLAALTESKADEAESQPIREQPLPFPHPPPESLPFHHPPPSGGSSGATTKILTISREGITRLRSYPVEKEDEGEF